MLCRVSKFRPGALWLWCLLLAPLAAGCVEPEHAPAPAHAPAPGPVPPDTDPPSPPPDGGPGTFDVQRYDLKGEFDWTESHLTATVGITFALKGGAVREIALDSAVDEVKAVRVAGGDALPYAADPTREKLTIDLSGSPDLAKSTELAIEIDYVAAAGASLLAIPPRKGDPIAVRTLYTDTEPLGAARWMPCFNDPSDRAVFSVDMRVDKGESMIANGDLVDDEEDGPSSHRVRYETGYSLPTYLMAFAIGDFEVERAMKGDLPLAIWHRRGVTGDYQRALDELGREIGHFERLLVPYPFEKYALVLLPDYPGGMENAGITFQSETGSTQMSLSSDLVLSGHELGHQWFGDLVTVKTWDDLWIKEGMATLLESEGIRVYTDESGVGTLNGDDFQPQTGEAIRDASIAPDDKYTSGPYSRAAWLLTQIRSLVGEEAFWATLRGVLEKHRFGNIGTDEFLDAFAPALGPDVTARAKRAVDAAALPRLALAPAPSGGVLMTLSDPEGALIAPMDLTWVAEDGSTRTQILEPDQPVEVARQSANELLVLDQSDRHPDWSVFLADEVDAETYKGDLVPLLMPMGAQQRSRFLEAGGAHQLAALQYGQPGLAPEEVTAFVTALDGEPAKVVALSRLCSAAGAEVDPVLRSAWREALRPLLLAPPATYGLDYASGFAACSELVGAEGLFAEEWSELREAVPSSGISEARLSYLADFTLPAGPDLATWGNVARKAGSIRARRIAIQHLRSSAQRLDPAEVPAYRAFFAGLLAETEVIAILRSDMQGLRTTKAATAAENAAGLDGLIAVLHSAVTKPVHATAVCTAFELTGDDAAAWSRFAAALADAPLSATAASYLQDPTACN